MNNVATCTGCQWVVEDDKRRAKFAARRDCPLHGDLAPPIALRENVPADADWHDAGDMSTSDGLGAATEPLNRLETLRAEIGYSEEEEGSVDALIDYKNALEELAAADGQLLAEIAAGVPTDVTWRSAAEFMERVAALLDAAGIARPARYTE